MLEELKFSIGGMEGWTKVDVKVEKKKVHYVTENLFCGQGEETKLNKADSKLFLQKIEELKIGKWKAKYCPEMRICDVHSGRYKTMDAITNAISDSCEPALRPDVAMQTVKDKTVIVVEVFPGAERP